MQQSKTHRGTPVESAIEKRVETAISEQTFPGCVIGVIRKDGSRYVLPYGQLTYEQSAKKVGCHTLYDIASVTKAIPTASLFAALVEEWIIRKVKFSDRLVNILPGFDTTTEKRGVRLKHLLTYTLDLDVPPLSDLKDLLPSEIIQTVIKAPLKSKPGSSLCYTNSTALLMGRCIEEIGNNPLEILAHSYFFNPLGMRHTTFNPLHVADKKEIAPTEICPWRKKTIQGEVHDEASYTLGKRKLGIAGLFSTAPDLLHFLEMLLNYGEQGGISYLKPKTVQKMASDQLRNGYTPAGLGWQLSNKNFMGKSCSEHTFGMTGFTGCSVVCDLEKETGLVILSNRTWPHRPQNSEAINEFRRDIADIVFSKN